MNDINDNLSIKYKIDNKCTENPTQINTQSYNGITYYEKIKYYFDYEDLK